MSHQRISSLIGRACFSACALVLCAAASAQQHRARDLSTGWEFRQVVASSDNTAQWHPATVPGDVHLDLLANKLIPDPFYRDNEGKLQWIEKADWEYRSSLNVTPEELRHQHVELVFEGLDSACDVFVNEQKVLHADNAFREFRADVKQVLKPGANTLRISFPAPDKSAAPIAAKDPWRERIGTQEKTYIRKPAYEYGWDWGPRYVTSGIWRPAHLDTWDAARIDHVALSQQGVSAASAHVNVLVQVMASADGPARVDVSFGDGTAQKKVAQSTILRPGMNQVTVAVDIEHPSLWYPVGYGKQPIYKFDVKLSAGKSLADEAQVKTGLRSIELHRELDQWGRSFEFRINGIPVYAKGADVIPFDSFPNRVTTKDYRLVLQSARDANMNMIRHWGGGYYETQEFYDICDELGIMVWQDFMFGNDWQPGTYDFKQQVEKEVRYQVERLRNHPSIVLWSGNNETEAAFGWGQNSTGKSPEVRARMWQDYLTIFSGVIARTVAELDPERPYWPSSPSADYEETSPQYETGDIHEWTVWHGRADFTEYETHNARFVTEYGFQSFPEMRTIEAFTTPEDRTSIFTPVMLVHQKNNAGNAIIHDYMTRYYGEPKDFPSFLYASQVLQAEGIKIGAEHWRRMRPRNMGGIYWQLNDCWPVASWASLDYYGRWKALQYYAKRFYAPLLVSPHVENGTLAVYIVSDKIDASSAKLRVRIMDFSGKIVKEESKDVQVPALSSTTPISIPLSTFLNANGTDSANLVAVAELLVDAKVISQNTAYFVPDKQLKLPEPQIASDIRADGKDFVVKLTSPVYARAVYVSFGDNDATFNDNYVNLLPNEPVEIRVTSPAQLDQLKSSMKVQTLATAFNPQQANTAATK